MNLFFKISLILLFSVLYFQACSPKEKSSPIFKKLSSVQTGITFENTITTNDTINIQTDFFLYNGAGIAAGDINNNGLTDLFFTGNMVSSRLYVNKGNMQFEDITEAAGLKTDQWTTGASMVDINNNGYLDIYVSVAGHPWSDPEDRSNLLFINNGDNTFTESAAEYGIDDDGFTTHAVFFDYNRNGYLDLFLLSNSPEDFARGETERHPFGLQSLSPQSYDQLYRNNGDGTFTNVSDEAGILKSVGYGLGVVVSDLNGNGWPDIYVSNDITPNDVLYVNNGDGTFTDKSAKWLRHTSFAGMGIDIADFTNNGWPDILQTDMMPEKLEDQKRMSGSSTYGGFMGLRQRGFYPHYNVNTLQANFGVSDDGDVIFSEIARMAGVAYTNWSWSALFGDFDNDGFKDIFITNGYPKAVNDFDFQTKMHNARRINDNELAQKRTQEILNDLSGYKISNYIFMNNRDLTFSDKTSDWGMDYPGYSYGAVYADLNNNGRLDLVVNNTNAPAFIFENVGSEETDSHYLQVRLKGEYPNVRGIGSKLILTADGQKQYIYHSPYRGYMSTMDDRVHFGLGKSSVIDSLKVIWPDGRTQILSGLQANQMVTLYQKDSAEAIDLNNKSNSSQRMFHPADHRKSISYKHREKSTIDYSIQPLLPYMISRQGPPLAVSDVTGNGLDDVFIGGAAGFPGKLFMQQEDGRFIEATEFQPWEADKDFDDWGALFFDANGNGLPDLYVASGGYHFSPASQLLQDRLYINHGNGRFLKDANALPHMITSTASISAGDFTGDGQIDLFVGGRLTPRKYPYPARSYLLRNDGGIFTDITNEAAPELLQTGGMITDALWIDFNEDGREDLVTAGEWMPIQFFKNNGTSLENVTNEMGLPSLRGWWFSLDKVDLKGNGKMDIIAGNLGLNYTYTTSENSKFGVYAADFSGNQDTDIVLTKEIDGLEYPFDGLAKLGREIYTIGLKFTTFEAFSAATTRYAFGSDHLNEALHYQADTFASVILHNKEDGTFTVSELPKMAQISPVKSILVHDFNKDGNSDLLIAGNMYHSEPNVPRADAGNGLWLKGDGNGNLTPVPPIESGFLAPMDARQLALIHTRTGKAVIVANNSDSLQVFSISNDF